jgi:4-amino-4-deoxy-L-arabinose transferase-like glycosyltransferase
VTLKTSIVNILKVHKVDIAFVVFLGVLIAGYWAYISEMQVPMWDGAAYLANARGWFSGSPLPEIYRPPLISWLIAGIWLITGENWTYAKPLAAVFTVGAAIAVYLSLRKDKGNLFSLGVTMLTILNAQVFYYGSQIYTEGISLFFVVATMWCLKTPKRGHWFLAGIMMGLAFASRYPIVLQCLTLFVVESLVRKDWRLSARTITGALPVLLVVVSAVYLKTGTFQTALAKDTNFTFMLSPFYIVNSISIWGPAFLLVSVALFSRRTYTDSYNYSFIAWFLASLLFWSSNSTNLKLRFVVGFTPAVSYLIVLAIENLSKSMIDDRRFPPRFQNPLNGKGLY